MSFERDLALVSWRKVQTVGDFVFMKRGTGETGWWHDHRDGTEYGDHPMDWNSEMKQHICRDCSKGFRP